MAASQEVDSTMDPFDTGRSRSPGRAETSVGKPRRLAFTGTAVRRRNEATPDCGMDLQSHRGNEKGPGFGQGRRIVQPRVGMDSTQKWEFCPSSRQPPRIVL